MKSIAIAIAALALSAPAARAWETWTGAIADSACGAKHESGGEMGEEMNDRDCTLACVKGGSKFVLVADGRVYRIANQDLADVRAHAGQKVRVTGERKDDVVTISKVESAP